MSGIDVEGQKAEARLWLDRANRDAATIRLILAQAPSLHDIAAFHCQQAAEKLLKALLVAAAVPFRKVHNLNELALQVAATHPDLSGTMEPLRNLTEWNFAFRYPGAAGNVDIPDAVTLTTTLAAIDRLRAAVAERLA